MRRGRFSSGSLRIFVRRCTFVSIARYALVRRNPHSATRSDERLGREAGEALKWAVPIEGSGMNEGGIRVPDHILTSLWSSIRTTVLGFMIDSFLPRGR
jgi:hypothetical protein